MAQQDRGSTQSFLQPPAPAGLTTAAVIWRVVAFAALALLALGIGIALSLPVAALAKARQIGEVAAITFSALGILIVSWFMAHKFDGVRLRAIGIGFDRPWVRHLAIGFLFGGGLITLAWLIFKGFGFGSFQPAHGSGRTLRLVVGAVFCVATAVQEEIVCRGYGFQTLYRRSPALAMMIGGLVFAGMHIANTGGTDPIALANLFLAHMFYAAAYLRTRSLWLPIGLHTGWNFVEAFVLGMPMSGRTPKGLVFTTTLEAGVWTGREFGPEGGLVVTVCLIAATAIIWFAVRQRRPVPDLLEVSTPAGAASPSLSPTTASRRILGIDVLRGIAVLGILPMNMQIFALFPAAVIYPYAGEFTSSTDIAAWTLLRVFIGTTDLLIFSMLFGAGLLMVERSSAASGSSGTALHYRRMAVLFAFGLCHAYLIWAGDILVTYAICGSIVYLLRKLPPVTLAAIGLSLFAVPMLVLVALQLAVGSLPEGMQSGLNSMLRPDAQAFADFHEVYGGGWLTQMQGRVPDAFANQTFNVLACMGWIAAGMMLFGMALHKRGVFTGVISDRGYGMMIGAGALAGLPLLLYSFAWNFSRQWRLPDGFFLGWSLREMSYLLLALGWIGAVMLICRRGKLLGVTAALGAVGRMALTNYLVQSVVCSLIFYGHGLGMVGRVDYVGLILITLVIWGGQLLVSPLWFRWFAFGPTEWAWRSLAYGRRQPMRYRAAAA